MNKVLHHFFSPSGRIGRKTWWLSYIALLRLLLAVNFEAVFSGADDNFSECS